MVRRRGLRGFITLASLALALVWAMPAVAAYNHSGESDSGRFRSAHPEATGSKLDSCTLCHTGGTTVSGGKTTNLGSCQWCHAKYGYDASGDIKVTLNVYGVAYMAAGRSAGAVTAIDTLDSDADGYANGAEIKASRYPGDATDDPSKIPASYRIYTLAQIKAMTAKTQFLGMNASKSDDAYSQYTGVTMETLLANAGTLSSATGIKVYAPDGFSVYHPLDPPATTTTGIYPVRWTYPQGTFLYNAVADLSLNPTGGWINYSSPAAAGRTSGSLIDVPGGLKLLLAYARDGASLSTGVLSTSNKLDGEGPYRVVPPQLVAGPLDQRSTNSTSTKVWPYDNNLDHNAGYSSRSATIIKVEPLPAGTTDINIFEAGWKLIDEGKVVVYGALERMRTSLSIRRSAAVVRRNKSFTLSGSLNLANVGDRIVVDVRKPGSKTWTRASILTVTSVNSSGGGNWRYTYKTKKRGVYRFRVRYLGDVTRTPCRSRDLNVRVK